MRNLKGSPTNQKSWRKFNDFHLKRIKNIFILLPGEVKFFMWREEKYVWEYFQWIHNYGQAPADRTK